MSKNVVAKYSKLSSQPKNEHVASTFLVRFHKLYYTAILLRSLTTSLIVLKLTIAIATLPRVELETLAIETIFV